MSMRAPLTAERKARGASTRLGIPLAEYQRRVAAGEKWCSDCRGWHSRDDFGARADRTDGLNYVCREANTARVRAYWQRKGGR